MKYEEIRYIHDLLVRDVEQKKTLLSEAEDDAYKYCASSMQNCKFIEEQSDFSERIDTLMQELNHAYSVLESFTNIDWYMKG